MAYSKRTKKIVGATLLLAAGTATSIIADQNKAIKMRDTIIDILDDACCMLEDFIIDNHEPGTLCDIVGGEYIYKN